MTNTRRRMVAGNWKMHGSKAMVESLLAKLKQDVSTQASAVDLIVFPPFVFLEQTQALLANSAVQWGAQNMASEIAGAYTGEVSGTMLQEFGCKYVLLGHSERRTIYGESDALIAKKVVLAKELGLKPILCVGETLAEREQGKTQHVVKNQLEQVLKFAGDPSVLNNMVLAYEPVWAIGTGLTASPEQAQEVHGFLRQQVAAQSPSIAEGLSILYGGSVKASNASALFSMPDIDGGLIGGASLDAQEFLQIYHSLT